MSLGLLLLLLLNAALHSSFANGQYVVSVACGTKHTCVVFNTSKMRCFGDSARGQLGNGNSLDRGGDPGDMGDNLSFVDLGVANSSIVKISVGDRTTCVLFDNGKIKCFGSNTYGQLGRGDRQHRGDDPNEMGTNLPFLDLGTGAYIVDVVVGLKSICALLDNNQIKCFGEARFGVLGTLDENDRGDERYEMGDNLTFVDWGTGTFVKQVVLGLNHICALLNNDQVKCMGDNQLGTLGYEDDLDRGLAAGNLGDNLPYVDFGDGTTVKEIVAGEYYSCVLLNTNQIKCFGLNIGGLGYGDNFNRGERPNEMGDFLPFVDLGEGLSVRRFAAGVGIHMCVILSNDRLKCFGFGDYGRLGYGNENSRGTGQNQMGDNLEFVDLGTILNRNITVKQVALGLTHTCALLIDGNIKCWGSNAEGELGYEDRNNRGDEPGEMGNNLPLVDLGSPDVPEPTPTSSPTTSSPTTRSPTSSPVTSAPTSSPNTSTPTSSPTTSVPTISPSLKGATTFVGQALLMDNENGGGNAWTNAEMRALEIEDIETLTQACLISESSLRTEVGFTLGRVLAFKGLFDCVSVPTPSPTAPPRESELSVDAVIAIVMMTLTSDY